LQGAKLLRYKVSSKTKFCSLHCHHVQSSQQFEYSKEKEKEITMPLFIFHVYSYNKYVITFNLKINTLLSSPQMSIQNLTMQNLFRQMTTRRTVCDFLILPLLKDCDSFCVLCPPLLICKQHPITSDVGEVRNIINESRVCAVKCEHLSAKSLTVDR
jgi:hypothetical protein